MGRLLNHVLSASSGAFKLPTWANVFKGHWSIPVVVYMRHPAQLDLSTGADVF